MGRSKNNGLKYQVVGNFPHEKTALIKGRFKLSIIFFIEG